MHSTTLRLAPLTFLILILVLSNSSNTAKCQDSGSAFSPLVSAREMISSGRTDSAIIILEQADFSILNPYGQWLLANAYFHKGRFNQSHQILNKLLKDESDFALWSYAYGLSGRCLYRQDRFEQAIQRLRRFRERFRRHPLAAECALDLARSLARLQRYDDALASYRDVILVYPISIERDIALQEYLLLCDSLGKKPYDVGHSELLGWARVDLTYARYAHLHKLAQEYWRLDDRGEIGNDAEMKWLEARTLEKTKHANNVKQCYQEIVGKYPQTSWAARAASALVQMECRQDNIDQAVILLENFEKISPDETYLSEALLATSKAFYRAGEYRKARSTLKKLLKNAPNSPNQSDALWLLGWTYWKSKRYRAAIRSWTTILENDPESGYTPAAHYWQSRALLKIHRDDEATDQLEQLAREYPANYYGILARIAICDHPLDHPIYADITLEAETEWLPFPDQSDSSLRSQRYRLLLDIGLPDFAIAEGDSLAASEDYINWEQHRALLGWQMGLDYPNHSQARKILEKSKLPPDSVAQILYPIVYQDLIGEAAARWEVPDGWILALMRQESSFDPKASSSEGAKGLLQVLPSTAQWMAKKYKIPDWKNLHNPRVNIRCGTAYFSWLVSRFDGAILPALAAHNAGHAAVERWWKTPNNDLAEWVESIPYTETRLFVKRVLTNAWTYAQLYPQRIIFETSTIEMPVDSTKPDLEK